MVNGSQNYLLSAISNYTSTRRVYFPLETLSVNTRCQNRNLPGVRLVKQLHLSAKSCLLNYVIPRLSIDAKLAFVLICYTSFQQVIT